MPLEEEQDNELDDGSGFHSRFVPHEEESHEGQKAAVASQDVEFELPLRIPGKPNDVVPRASDAPATSKPT